MSKINYKFNPKSLTYEKVRTTFVERFWQFLSYIATGLVFATLTIFLSRQFLPSPTEKRRTVRLRLCNYNTIFCIKKWIRLNWF